MAGAWLGLLLVACGGASAAELSGTPEELREYLRSETRTVTISETATENAYTDIAKITLIVSTKERALALALERNNELRRTVVRQLVEFGIAEDAIRSSRYSASPQYGWFGNTPNSFEVVNSLVVTVDEEPAFRRVAEISDQNDAVRFGGVEFEHSEKIAFEEQVRNKAIDAVMAMRDVFQQRLGLTLRPVSFATSNAREENDVLEEIIVTGSRVDSSRNMDFAAASTFDELEYRATVSVTFDVVPLN